MATDLPEQRPICITQGCNTPRPERKNWKEAKHWHETKGRDAGKPYPDKYHHFCDICHTKVVRGELYQRENGDWVERERCPECGVTRDNCVCGGPERQQAEYERIRCVRRNWSRSEQRQVRKFFYKLKKLKMPEEEPNPIRGRGWGRYRQRRRIASLERGKRNMQRDGERILRKMYKLYRADTPEAKKAVRDYIRRQGVHITF